MTQGIDNNKKPFIPKSKGLVQENEDKRFLEVLKDRNASYVRVTPKKKGNKK